MIISNIMDETSDRFICKYCGRSFTSRNGLVSHLKGCEKRRFETLFKVGGFAFTVFWNPTRRVQHGLKRLEAGDDPKAFIYILRFLRDIEIITDYRIDQGGAAAPGTPQPGAAS